MYEQDKLIKFILRRRSRENWRAGKKWQLESRWSRGHRFSYSFICQGTL